MHPQGCIFVPCARLLSSPPYITSQVDEDIAFENEANGGSNSDSELEFEDDSDLGAVEDDIELEITPGQTMVLGLQSGKSWAEVESKLYPVSYSGTCIKTIKKRQEEKFKSHRRAPEDDVACQGLGSVAGRKRLITCFASELSPSATQWCDERLEALMLRTQQHTGQSYLGRPRSGATNYQRQNRGTRFISILVQNSGRFYAVYASRYELFS